MDRPNLTIPALIKEAKQFCDTESLNTNTNLFGITDGKAVGTFIEQKFKDQLHAAYAVQIGNAANGIDLPSADILTDIKVTSIRQPPSTCPFKDARQKIYGLGYNVLVFVYDKSDDHLMKTSVLNFVSCTFIEKERTADYQTTLALRQFEMHPTRNSP